MRCNYCHRQTYIAYICPYCKECYCLEHRNPKAHQCQAYQQINPTIVAKPQKAPVEKMIIQTRQHLTKIQNLQKNLFLGAFTLVVIEEVFRLIGYLRYSPYLEPNIYVAILSQIITPYVSSSIFFLTICTLLFATKKLSEKCQPKNEFTKFLSKAIPVGIYTTIVIIYACSIINWLLIILH